MIKAMRNIMKLNYASDETPGELVARVTKLSALAFPGKVRENAAIQLQLADLFVDVLANKHIRHDAIKEVTARLSVAICLAKDGEKV